MDPNQRFTIDVVDDVTGKPTHPEDNGRMFVSQCGVLVRDHVAITFQERNKPKKAGPEFTSYVNDEIKNNLWEKLISHFILPPEYEEFEADGTTPVPGGRERRERVKHFALSKMAELFRRHKNELYSNYVAVGKTPDWKGKYEGLREQWPAFVEYKNSPQAKARSAKNKLNAEKKIYHHRLGPGGYKTAMPKWEAIEADLRSRGIPVGTDGWDERAKLWWYAHGGKLDLETGECVFQGQIVQPTKDIIKAMEDAQKGLFRPDREKDVLWRALGNDEKGGRARGRGGIPWKEAFPECADSYRSRKRRKDREADRLGKLENELAGVKKVVEALSQRSYHQSHEDFPLLENSQRRSSVASTEVQVHDQLQDVAPILAPHYPVDDVREMTPCELYQPMMNLTIKVATATALPCTAESLHHGNPIPRGYARVSVDDILEGYDELEIDIATPEGDKKLGDVKRQIILWKKMYIRFPGSARRPPTSPRLPPSPAASTHDRRPPSPAASPHGRRPPSPAASTHGRRRTSPPPRNTPPPPHAHKERFIDAAALPRHTQKKQKGPKIVDIPSYPPKRGPNGLTHEENEAMVAAHNKKLFEPKKPEPKQVYDPKQVKWATDMLNHPSQISMNLPNDYDRELRKQAREQQEKKQAEPKKKKRDAKCGGQIAQLGQQKKQVVSPLKVNIDKEFQADMDKDLDPRAIAAATELGITLSQAKKMAEEQHMTIGQLLGYEHPDTKPAYQYVKGKPMLENEDELRDLPTNMRMLHNWYMRHTSKNDAIDFLTLPIKEQHHFKEYFIFVQMTELFQLYNKRELDKSIMGVYCL